MQAPGLNCERDEYPPIGFWQDQDIHSQKIRMVPRAENGRAGAALFGLGFCRYGNDGMPPASTQNAHFDRLSGLYCIVLREISRSVDQPIEVLAEDQICDIAND